MKNILIHNGYHQIIFVSATYEGATHDKAIADQEAYDFPSASIVLQDTGFQGFIRDAVTIKQPKKKPRHGELTPDEKAENQRISRTRVAIEHVIASVKRFRILKDICRMTFHRMLDILMKIGCGLHNFIVQQRLWKEIQFKS